MGNGKSLQKIVKLRKLAKLVKIRETAAIPAEPAKKKKTKQNKTDTLPRKRNQKKAEKMRSNAKKNNKKIHHKLPLNVNGKSGQKLLDCRCRRCAARDGELPNCWRWKELQKDVSRWNWRQQRPKRNVQLNKNQSGLRYQRRFSVSVPRVPPYPSPSHASTDVAAAVASAALPIFDCDCDCQQVALTAPQTFA